MRGWSPIIDIAALGPGQGLRLFATFKPTPLLRVLESKGFVHEAKELEGGEWEVLFRPSKAAVADGDGGAVLPTDDSVWSEPAQHLDNRDLDPVCTENLNPHVMVMARAPTVLIDRAAQPHRLPSATPRAAAKSP